MSGYNGDVAYSITVGCPTVDDEGDFLCGHDVEIPVDVDWGEFREYAEQVGLAYALLSGPSGQLGPLPTRCDGCDHDYTEAEMAVLQKEAKQELRDLLCCLADDLNRARRRRIA